MSRFNDPGLLTDFTQQHRYPAIHDQIFAFCTAYLRGFRVLDLCCAYGLLGHRLMHKLGLDVWGLDGDEEVVKAARAAGLALVDHMKITEGTLPALASFIQNRRIESVVARRCLPELIADTGIPGPVLAVTLKDAGIKEIVIQGRVKMARTVNPLGHLDAEIEALAPYFHVDRRIGDLAYLRVTA